MYHVKADMARRAISMGSITRSAPLFLLLASLLGALPPSARGEGDAPSAEAKRLLAVLEDSRRDREDRALAAYELGRLKEPVTVDRLIGMLPGDYDAVTLQVVRALHLLGCPRAVPVLERMLLDEHLPESGKLPVAIRSAIKACKKNR
jgi:HEAT repeat protein